MDNANEYDISKLSLLILNRNSKCVLDLSQSTMIEVLEKCAEFHQKFNPNYKNSAVISLFKRLEKMLGATIMPIDITDEFYAEIQSYLLTVPNEKGKVVKPSTILNYFDIIKGTLNWATKHNCPISETYNIYRVSTYEKPKVVLNPSLLAHIYYFKFDDSETRKRIKQLAEEMHINRFSFSELQRVKDLFIIECQLGQRYSDACRFDKSNFDITGSIFKCTQLKTGGKAQVSITENAIDPNIALEILKKYDWKAPTYEKDISNVNHYLHLLCRAIGDEFDAEMTGENKINGKIVKETYKVWQLVTTHTARRTFITYWANSDKMNVVKLQKCTGHKDVRQISRYTIVN